METEKILLAEIYQKNGSIIFEIPNYRDTSKFELYGFLKCYIELLKDELLDNMNEWENN